MAGKRRKKGGFLAFMNLEKAYDRVDRGVMRHVLEFYGVEFLKTKYRVCQGVWKCKYLWDVGSLHGS